MADIYEIDNRLQTLCNEMFDTETGEIVQDEETFNKLFDEIQLDLNAKIENTMCFVKNLNADAKAIKDEKAQLDKREKQKEALANRLQNRIDYYIKHQYMDKNGNVDNQALNKYKFETPKVRISYAKSSSVNITDMTQLDKKFIKTETTETPIKSDIKDAIKNGEAVNGAEIVTKVTMRVK